MRPAGRLTALALLRSPLAGICGGAASKAGYSWTCTALGLQPPLLHCGALARCQRGSVQVGLAGGSLNAVHGGLEAWQAASQAAGGASTGKGPGEAAHVVTV